MVSSSRTSNVSRAVRNGTSLQSAITMIERVKAAALRSCSIVTVSKMWVALFERAIVLNAAEKWGRSVVNYTMDIVGFIYIRNLFGLASRQNTQSNRQLQQWHGICFIDHR
jgi:hypothetical protein